VKVGQVIPPHQGHRPGRGDLRGGERAAVEYRPLDDPHAGQLRDPPAVAALGRAEQDGDPLAVVGGEFLDGAVGEGVVPADDQVVPVLAESAGNRGHGES
jgi:hypothetical protein